MCCASATVTTHSGLLTIGIEKEHYKVEILIFLNKYKAICSYAEAPVAQATDKLTVTRFNDTGSIVNDDKVISGTFVFVKVNFHCVKMELIIDPFAFNKVKKAKICETFYQKRGYKDINLLRRHAI